MEFFLKQLESRREGLRNLEKQVFDYIVRHPEAILAMNVETLAKEVYVSTATVSRTCKQLGYHGFQDLKFSLSKHLTSKSTQKKSEIVHLSHHIERMNMEWHKTLDLIDEASIVEAARRIKNSNQVEFFGVGTSYPTCVEAARKLIFAGCMCAAREDWDTLYHMAENLTADDLTIFVSSSGETGRIIEFAQRLKRNGVPIIAVIGRENSTLEALADLTLKGAVEDWYYGEVDMSSRFLLSIVLDLLVLTFMQEN